MNKMVKFSRKKKPIHVNSKWAKKVSFTEFKKVHTIAALSSDEQIKLYEKHSGKKVKTKKGEE